MYFAATSSYQNVGKLLQRVLRVTPSVTPPVSSVSFGTRTTSQRLLSRKKRFEAGATSRRIDTPQGLRKARFEEYLCRMPTWESILHWHKVQPGSFDSHTYAACIYTISTVSAPYEVLNNEAFEEVTTALLDRLQAEPASFDTPDLCRIIAGLAHTCNPTPYTEMGGADSFPVEPLQLPKTAQAVVHESLNILQARFQNFEGHNDISKLPEFYIDAFFSGMAHLFPSPDTPAVASSVADAAQLALKNACQRLSGRVDELHENALYSILLSVATNDLLSMEHEEIQQFVYDIMYRVVHVCEKFSSAQLTTVLWSLATIRSRKQINSDELLSAYTAAFKSCRRKAMISRWWILPDHLGTLLWALSEGGDDTPNDIKAIVSVAERCMDPELHHLIGGTNAKLVQRMISKLDQPELQFSAAPKEAIEWPINAERWSPMGSLFVPIAA